MSGWWGENRLDGADNNWKSAPHHHTRWPDDAHPHIHSESGSRVPWTTCSACDFYDVVIGFDGWTHFWRRSLSVGLPDRLRREELIIGDVRAAVLLRDDSRTFWYNLLKRRRLISRSCRRSVLYSTEKLRHNDLTPQPPSLKEFYSRFSREHPR